MNTFAALADPTRQQIVLLLAQNPRSAGEIVAHFSISAPAISQHLKILHRAHLVSVRTEAQRRIYSLDSTGLAEVGSFLEQIRRFWNPKLDALQQLLEQEETNERER